MPQFDRQINLRLRLLEPRPSPNIDYIGQLEITDLRIAFSILKTTSLSTNTCDVRIWNLSKANRNRISEYGFECKVFAGYRQEAGTQLLFTGNATQVSHFVEQPEVISQFQVGDGERTVNNTIIAVSFAPGTTVRTVINNIAERLGLDIVTTAELNLIQDKPYIQGFSSGDLAIDVLRKACDNLGVEPSVQNNALSIVAINQTTLAPPAEINVDNGMVGVPQLYTDKREFLWRDPNAPPVGWKVRTLLRPDILPNQSIRVRSVLADIDGLFKVITVRHDGDNFGSLWTSTFELVQI